MDTSAQASTDIKKALQETVKLEDGRQGYIFTELPPIGLLSRWHCHICGRTISSERSLVMHLTHPVHTSNLRAPQHPAAHFKKFLNKTGADSRKDGDSWENTDVVPGEPVPPGMEDSIETCHIQEAFDSYKGPLVGLEYIVELVNLEDKSEPRYICLLCEKRGDPRSVMVHVTSQNHFLKYICCFFRTVGNILNLTKVTPQNKRGYSIAVRKVGAEIEKHYGRLKPTSAAAETFAQKKYEILRAIDEKEHFRETASTTFEHLVTPEMIAKYNDEEEDENLRPITKPMEELKTQSSLGAFEKQKLADRINDKKFSQGAKSDARGRDRDIKHNGSAKKEDPDVVIIEDDPKGSRSLSPISPPRSRDRSRKSRDRSQDRGQRRSSPAGGRRRSRSRSRTRRDSPRRMLDKRRDYSPDRRRGYSPDRRRPNYSPDRRNRDRRELSPDRRTRDYDDRRTRDYDDRRRREVLDRDRDRYDRRPMDNRDRSPLDNRRKSPRRRTPERRMSLDRSSRRSEEKKRDKYDEYRSELRKLEIELEDKLKQYESRPEKHPLYNEEWKSFWNKRYKEVQQQGRDPNTYDFKPEWIVYWGKRMKEINDEEFRLKHEELKRQMTAAQPRRGVVDLLGGASPVSSEDEREPVTVEDIKNTWKGLTGTDLSGPPVKKRSPSPKNIPWEEPVPVREEMSTAGHQSRQYEVAPPVIHCLRLLSVLECYLGSLGPRAIDLLSRALVLERTGLRKSMTLLEQPDVHVFFDTVKEKVRGALMAYIVEKHLVTTCRMSINIIEKMLRANPPKENPTATSSLFGAAPTAATAPVVVPGIGMVEKMAVAQQIATALLAQGRSDVSQEELESLINAVVGIVQASNASFNANTSSVNFFSQLNMKNSTADAHINTLLSSMIKVATGKSDTIETKPEEAKSGVIEDKAEEELKEKLTKFNSLSREEQQSLIVILKDLEKTDPKKVENLRKYVTVGSVTKKDESPSEPAPPVDENVDSTSNDDVKKPPERRPVKSDDEDEDDDDYSFEDVYKAASEKLKTDKKMPSQHSVELNSDSNMSRASATNPLPTVSEKAKLSDFSSVFGPQRNPAEKPLESRASTFKFNPKNSAPDVADPNSQMSTDEEVMIANSASSYLPKPAPAAANSASSYLPKPVPAAGIPILGSANNTTNAAPGYGSNTIDYGFTVNPENSQSTFPSDSMYNEGQMGSYGSLDRFSGNIESNNLGRGPAPPPFGGGNQGYSGSPTATFGSNSSGPFGDSSGPGGPFGGNRGPGGPPGGSSGPGGSFGGNRGPGGLGGNSGPGGSFDGNRGPGGPPGGSSGPGGAFGSNRGPGGLGGNSGPGGSFDGNRGPGGPPGGSSGPGGAFGSSSTGGPFGGSGSAGGPFGGNRGPSGPFGGSSGPGGPFGGNGGSGGAFGGSSGPYGSGGTGGPFGGSNYGDSRGGNFGPGGPSRGGPGQFNSGSFGDSRSNFNQRQDFQENNLPDSRNYFPDSSRYFPR